MKKNKSDIIREHYVTIGKKGGKSKSPAKQAAARANGLKGGAPSNFNTPPKIHTLKAPCPKEGCKVTNGHEHL